MRVLAQDERLLKSGRMKSVIFLFFTVVFYGRRSVEKYIRYRRHFIVGIEKIVNGQMSHNSTKSPI